MFSSVAQMLQSPICGRLFGFSHDVGKWCEREVHGRVHVSAAEEGLALRSLGTDESIELIEIDGRRIGYGAKPHVS